MISLCTCNINRVSFSGGWRVVVGGGWWVVGGGGGVVGGGGWRGGGGWKGGEASSPNGCKLDERHGWRASSYIS